MFVVLVGLACWTTPTIANADWTTLKNYLRPGVTVSLETKERVEIIHQDSKTKVIITVGTSGNAHLFRQLRQRRGGNPYWAWFAGVKYGDISQQTWGKIFRFEFLRLLRRSSPQLSANAPG
jgi:hypothetical protein